jgi:hypothetical protein
MISTPSSVFKIHSPLQFRRTSPCSVLPSRISTVAPRDGNVIAVQRVENSAPIQSTAIAAAISTQDLDMSNFMAASRFIAAWRWLRARS